jgi:hypothetical protein
MMREKIKKNNQHLVIRKTKRSNINNKQKNNTNQENKTMTNHNIRSHIPNYSNILDYNPIQCAKRQISLQETTQRIDIICQHKIRQQNVQNQPFQGQNWYGDMLVKHNNWETGEYMDTIRICLININGISQDLNWIKWDTTFKKYVFSSS